MSTWENFTTFADDEKLIRLVSPDDIYWTEEGGVSPAAFKTSKGLSCGRSCGMLSVSDTIRHLRINKKLKGDPAQISYKKCIEGEIFVKYEDEADIYHCELWNSEKVKKLSGVQALYLANNVVVLSRTNRMSFNK